MSECWINIYEGVSGRRWTGAKARSKWLSEQWAEHERTYSQARPLYRIHVIPKCSVPETVKGAAEG